MQSSATLTAFLSGSMSVASACTNSIPRSSNIGATGNVMSCGLRFPNGSQIRLGLNRNRSLGDTTVTSTSPCSSCLTASAAVSPPKLDPRTSTFLRNATSNRRDDGRRLYPEGYGGSLGYGWAEGPEDDLEEGPARYHGP